MPHNNKLVLTPYSSLHSCSLSLKKYKNSSFLGENRKILYSFLSRLVRHFLCFSLYIFSPQFLHSLGPSKKTLLLREKNFLLFSCQTEEIRLHKNFLDAYLLYIQKKLFTEIKNSLFPLNLLCSSFPDCSIYFHSCYYFSQFSLAYLTLKPSLIADVPNLLLPINGLTGNNHSPSMEPK